MEQIWKPDSPAAHPALSHQRGVLRRVLRRLTLARHAGPDKGPGPRAPVCPAARLAERSVDLTTTSAGSAPGQANRAVISSATLEPAASPAKSAIKVEGLLCVPKSDVYHPRRGPKNTFIINLQCLLCSASSFQTGFTDDVRGQTSFRPRESFEHRPIKEPVEKQLQSMHFPEIEESEWIGGEHQVLQTTVQILST
ncbi:hypothetical protein DFH09DRAFT_1181444 [Mycena vulgaris]|nr:hypothetical protein DFH09DRAFT_1181444 [Mycena vulgaris]